MRDQRAGQGMEDGGAELWVQEEGGPHRQGEIGRGRRRESWGTLPA